jgi:hypothetical protein
VTPGSKHERRKSDDTITFGSAVTESAARKQDVEDRINTPAVLVISEDKSVRGAGNEAGYFVHEWQALRDQARRMII